MSALSAATKREFVGDQQVLNLKTAGNDTYYEGALLQIDADGYADVPSDTASLPPCGVYSGRQGQSFAVANGDHDEIEVLRGLCWVAFSGAAQSDVGELFYLSDDNTLTQTAGSKTWAVLCLGYKSGYVLVDFANPVYLG
jgi:hypothetical protein